MKARLLDFFTERRLIAAAVILAATIYFFTKTQAFTGLQTAYSNDVNFRLQTNAFFSLRLAVQDTPIAHMHDWAWYKGMHQIWGLGIPLLRFPFEAVASLFGAPFPDRLVLMLLYAVTALGVFFLPVAGRVSESDWFDELPVQLLLVVILLLNPALQNLVGASFNVYEEAVFCGCLNAILLLALTMRVQVTQSRSAALFAAAAAGYTILIRPTCLIYGVASLVLVACFMRSQPRRIWIAMGALFSIGPGVFLLTNYLRFGDAFDSGHYLSLPSLPHAVVTTRFGFPSTNESVWSSMRTFYGYMFFDSNPERWVSVVWKRYEFYFTNFTGWNLLFFVVSHVSPLLYFAARKKRWVPARLWLTTAQTALIWSTLGWSAVCFLVLSCFYVRFPGIVSRYYSDFIPAFYAPIALVAGSVSLKTHPWGRWLLLGVSLAWVCANPIIIKLNPSGLGNANALNAVSQTERWRIPKVDLPKEYVCGGADYKKDMAYNGLEWKMLGDCSVEEGTFFFLEIPDCVAISVAPLSGISRGYREALEAIRVKVDRFEWQRMASVATGEGGDVTQTFCGAEPGGVKLMAIAFVRPDQIGIVKRPDLKLLAVRPVPHP